MPIDIPPHLNERVLFWNKAYRASLLILVIFTCGLITWVAYSVNHTTRAIKETQDWSSTSTVQARIDNKERQDNLKRYIKCILLIRYDHPELNANSTKEQVSSALDDCSKRN